MEQALDGKSTRTLPAGEAALASAVAHILGGQTVAIPTETVYGLAADASNGEAVARIFAAKNRPSFNPLICHVTDIAMAEEFAVFDPLSRALADAFWPGALTLVLPLKAHHHIHPLVTAGLDTVAVRAPQGFGAELIAAAGRPLAAPSANASGRISATTAEAVAESLDSRISLIVDGGPARVGVESTIVKVNDSRIDLLRPGGVPVADIEKVAGFPVSRSGGNAKIEAPGMMQSHYAPLAKVRLNAKTVEEGEALLGFGPERAKGAERAKKVLVLSENGDTIEAAANLFDFLRRLDTCGARTIAVEPIPDEGLGEAINDRLRRAAAPRDIR
ncbi:L-threonylcarbamoyladenylate synthase [Oricola cellulosilytica]|uniref:Threonylcarbamoyl-AMP synthase n=1 Tax=Oricola cellulosilytica TaxID=1429082 RepID=A0A4R0PBL5_9HYPH|nr:L-threonylcarbamoyladenylate synthase [Oricola cellulosilytica]TCD13431.1 threonylcarbamoyl-AMP synthase [Oricola cellulosilytica]